MLILVPSHDIIYYRHAQLAQALYIWNNYYFIYVIIILYFKYTLFKANKIIQYEDWVDHKYNYYKQIGLAELTDSSKSIIMSIASFP